VRVNIIRPNSDDHSDIFLEMAELLCFSIQELGHESTISLSQVYPNYLNIVIGVFYPHEFFELLPEGSVIINTEPLYERGDLVQWSDKLIHHANKYYIWDYSSGNVEKMAALDIKNVDLLRFGFQAELQRIPQYPDSERPIDVMFYGSSNERREKITDQITAKGLVFKTFFRVYGAERDASIARSKMVINHHFNRNGVFEIVRLHYLLNNGVAIVPEIGIEEEVDPNYLNCLVGVPYEGLVDRCIWLNENPDELLNLREKALSEFKKIPQVEYMQELFKKF